MNKHTWTYCGHCGEWAVTCGHCDNLTCTAGSGEDCPDECEEAYALYKEGMPKIIIAGGRDFDDYDFLVDSVNSIDPPDPFELVSGKAKGADALGERYAKDNGYPIKAFPADWTSFGKAAGPIRNGQMAEYADALIVFWDGKSRGTASMIKIAKAGGLEVKVFKYNET